MAFLVQDSRNAGAKIRILRKANVQVRWGLVEEKARQYLGT